VRVTLHKSVPLIISLIAGTTLLLIGVLTRASWQSFYVQIGLTLFSFYPLGVGLEWLFSRR